MFKLVPLAALIVLSSAAIGQAQVVNLQKVPQLEPGRYDLKLITPVMPKKNREITLPAQVTTIDDEVVVYTQGMSGNKIVLKGSMLKGEMKVGMTAIEKGEIISFHYVGVVKSDQLAEGEFYVFVDGKLGFSGEWSLKKSPPEKAKP
ncbi:hypothetical protein GC197_05320 [bacterium]|nr:hypothetical protein [bacterium]